MKVQYDDIDGLKALLVGHEIIRVDKARKRLDGWHHRDTEVISFTLDNDVVLEARETDGWCSCSNGCWSVANNAIPEGVIMNVEIEETDLETGEPIREGYDGWTAIRMFVMDDLGNRVPLIESEGMDNGYYGWGYELHVRLSEGD